MKDIAMRRRFIKVYSYRKFDKLVKKEGYSELQKFVCMKAPSLQKFFREEVTNATSIYIIYDTNAKFIVGYYTLIPACMIREYEGENNTIIDGRELIVRKNIPCLEIEKFAVNEKYLDWLKRKGYNNRKIGHYIFEEYIMKTIILLSDYMNFSFVILHAIKNTKVIQAYRNMGFETFEDDEMNIVSLLEGVSSIKEDYVKDCKFMYQSMEQVINKLIKGGM